MDQIKATLQPWTLIALTDGTIRLFGRTHQDERSNPKTDEFADGHRICTSPLVQTDLKKHIARTETGSVYRLGPSTAAEQDQLIRQARLILGAQLVERPAC